MGSTDANKPLKIIAAADDFGCTLKDSFVEHLQSKGIEVQDLDTNKYYNFGEEVGKRVSEAKHNENQEEIKGMVACGTGFGVSIFSNKFPGVCFVTCDSVEDAQNCRSINNSNVILVGGMHTIHEEGFCLRPHFTFL